MSEDDAKAKKDDTVTKAEEEPATKKVKTGKMEQAPASEWPEAWVMPDGECEDQKAPNKQEPNVPVTVEQLQDLGIWCVYFLDFSSGLATRSLLVR